METGLWNRGAPGPPPLLPHMNIAVQVGGWRHSSHPGDSSAQSTLGAGCSQPTLPCLQPAMDLGNLTSPPSFPPKDMVHFPTTLPNVTSPAGKEPAWRFSCRPIPISTLHGASRCAHAASATHPALQHKCTRHHLSQKARLCS